MFFFRQRQGLQSVNGHDAFESIDSQGFADDRSIVIVVIDNENSLAHRDATSFSVESFSLSMPKISARLRVPFCTIISTRSSRKSVSCGVRCFAVMTKIRMSFHKGFFSIASKTSKPLVP